MMSDGSRSLVNWDSLELQIERARQCLRQGGLADARDVLDQEMAP